MKTITITIIVPEGVSIGIAEVSESEPPDMREAAAAVFAQELKPVQSSGKPSCPAHGPMFYKEGTNKSGKPYAGWFCGADGCETKPIWSKAR